MQPKDEVNKMESKETTETAEVSQTGSAKQSAKAKSKQASSKKSQTKKKATSTSKSKAESKKSEGVSLSKESSQASVNLVEIVLREFINIQKVWFEISLQQTEMLLKLVSNAAGVKSESTEAIAKMMRQNTEDFIALQNQWSKVLARQSSEITGSLKHISDPSSYPAVFKRNLEVFLEGVSQMQNAWAEFLQKQSEQVSSTIKKSLGADEKSSIAYVANFADSMLKNILEAQRRWLEVATGLFSSGKPAGKEKK